MGFGNLTRIELPNPTWAGLDLSGRNWVRQRRWLLNPIGLCERQEFQISKRNKKKQKNKQTTLPAARGISCWVAVYSQPISCVMFHNVPSADSSTVNPAPSGGKNTHKYASTSEEKTKWRSICSETASGM